MAKCKRKYIEAFDREGNTAKKTAGQWADYQAFHGNPTGNSASAIGKRYAKKAVNGLTNQQIIDSSLIEQPVEVRGVAKKAKNVDRHSLLSKFNRTALV